MANLHSFGERIELLLDELAKTPTDLTLHQQLRDAALRHKAAGGPDLGIFQRLKRPRDPLQRLIQAQRVWSFDPGNSDRAVTVLQAVDKYAQSIPDTNIEPLQQWLAKILMQMEGDCNHPIS